MTTRLLHLPNSARVCFLHFFCCPTPPQHLEASHCGFQWVFLLNAIVNFVYPFHCTFSPSRPSPPAISVLLPVQNHYAKQSTTRFFVSPSAFVTHTPQVLVNSFIYFLYQTSVCRSCALEYRSPDNQTSNPCTICSPCPTWPTPLPQTCATVDNKSQAKRPSGQHTPLITNHPSQRVNKARRYVGEVGRLQAKAVPKS